FLVEVMGRHSGYIALYTALAGGAEVVALPETETNVAQIVQQLQVLKARGKKSIMIVVAEGDETGGAEILNEDLKKAGCPFQTRVLTLGHLQRGGTPVPDDRILASRLGDFAVQAIAEGETGSMAGEVGRQLVLTRFQDAYANHKPVPEELLELLKVMAS
ncbi:MAG: 6-phosphofructokinase, partial [Candidatus Nealsonbacteria bacterium]|nr:6-phosphofructokinase [Candidatus Nealsonbacteria bacterium]